MENFSFEIGIYWTLVLLVLIDLHPLPFFFYPY
jgi:hypothetical protein